MDNNLQMIGRAVDYIEEHLTEENLSLDRITGEIGYSKYHLHRMFTFVVGIPIHRYILRRRLTEAARMLVFTAKPLTDIALCSGYDTQRSFSRSFKSMFRCTPSFYRKRNDFLPLQMKYDVRNRRELRGDKMLDVKMAEEDKLYLVGYDGRTEKGFKVIGKCWKLLHKNKDKIGNRTDQRFLIGVNDYSQFKFEHTSPVFHYIAAAQVSLPEWIPKNMKSSELPSGRYAVFTLRGKNEDSLEPVVDYIYRQWFPYSTCRLNEHSRYDFAKYGEETDEKGESEIQFWVPVL